jgi:hypothetical protein
VGEVEERRCEGCMQMGEIGRIDANGMEEWGINLQPGGCNPSLPMPKHTPRLEY